MIISTVGMVTHSSDATAGAMVVLGDHGIVGMVVFGVITVHTLGTTGAGVAVGATTAMDMADIGAEALLHHVH